MKKIFIPALAVLSILTISCSEEDSTTTNQPIKTKKISTSLGLMRGWSEAGNCIHGYGNCALAVVGGTFLGQENIMPVKLQLQNNTLKFDNQINKVNADGAYLKFYNNTEIATDIAKNLGQESITIVAGTYQTDYSQNAYGSTTVIVKVK